MLPEGAALYDLRPCDSGEVFTPSLATKHANIHRVTIHRLTIAYRERTFVVAVVAADHMTARLWSSSR